VALQGTIETFALPEVLRLLGSSAKTGRLRVSGDRGSGSVWVDGGKVVGAEATGTPEDSSPATVMFELLRYVEGSFSFDDDQVTSRDGSPQDIEVLLGDAVRHLAEWKEIEAVIPSLDLRIVLATDLPAAEVVIDANRWHAIVAVASGESPRAIADALGLDELSACRRARELVEDGLVIVSETPRPLEADVDAEPVDEIGEAIDHPAEADVWDRPMASDSTLAISAPEEPEPAPPLPTEPRSAARAELDAMASGFGLQDLAGTPAAHGPVASDPMSSDPMSNSPISSDPMSSNPMSSTPMSNSNGFDHGFASDPSQDPAFSFAAPGAGSSGLDDPGSPLGSSLGNGFLFESPPTGAALFAEDVVLPPPPPPPPPPHGHASGAPLFGSEPAGFNGDHDSESGDAAEVARQLANLSPKAARAVAAAARASTVEEREAALAEVTSEGDEPINRGLLLKFLSSVQT